MARFVPAMMAFCCVALAAGLVAALTETGCAPVSLTKPVRDARFFLANPSEREATLAACRDNPGGAVFDPECLNARTALIPRAADRAKSKPVRDVPFYLANPEVMRATIAACRNNPGGTVLDADCLNARAASIRREMDPANKTMPQIN